MRENFTAEKMLPIVTEFYAAVPSNDKNYPQFIADPFIPVTFQMTQSK
ncbi:hypothetical protein XNC1_4352 [Xenorhabdus nematophila ATCC 19061]|uniref:Uncharacterized protein n=1 Tax=Xenorhabdus nematophila (strain ATCC 19061 / DSM 3370 / CCUG 14189 / LMG 1036 / NCIMB 9965 / AN6) TaxID=406817 RepID=D3VEC3_XENNA|nr:hypothetical protein XNC1_4352 [Xenorhabdus nematophila ATCC 19061]CEK25189.1 hypothetical protein XNC2_4202 [Xenorhabdus nematophila AN6/1]